ncbi:hypothetical protein CsatA_017651 [Cannabis sativa]
MEERGWDVEIIEDMFEERDAQLILSIQLSDSTTADSWHWMMEHSGFYSVKSAYNYLQSSSGSWLHFEDDSYWKRLWKIEVPSKVLHFLWKACSGSLPTKVHSWFFNLLDSKHSEVIVDAAMISWSIWKTRNEVFWQNKNCTALGVVQSARKALDQWRVATKNTAATFATGVLSNSNIWRRPLSGKIKVNVDGAIFETQRMFGFGCVARDHTGQLLEAISDSKFGVVLPEIAEVVGLKEALSWIKRKGWEDVFIETDSLMIVQAINSSVHMPSYFGLLVEDCRLILSSLKNVFISFVYRSANKAAHSLARASCSLSGCLFNERSAPLFLKNIVMAEAIP